MLGWTEQTKKAINALDRKKVLLILWHDSDSTRPCRSKQTRSEVGKKAAEIGDFLVSSGDLESGHNAHLAPP